MGKHGGGSMMLMVLGCYSGSTRTIGCLLLLEMRASIIDFLAVGWMRTEAFSCLRSTLQSGTLWHSHSSVSQGYWWEPEPLQRPDFFQKAEK